MRAWTSRAAASGKSVDDDGMDGALAQQFEQRGHIGFELFRVRLPAGRDAVEDRAAAAEQEAAMRPTA